MKGSKDVINPITLQPQLIFPLEPYWGTSFIPQIHSQAEWEVGPQSALSCTPDLVCKKGTRTVWSGTLLWLRKAGSCVATLYPFSPAHFGGSEPAFHEYFQVVWLCSFSLNVSEINSPDSWCVPELGDVPKGTLHPVFQPLSLQTIGGLWAFTKNLNSSHVNKKLQKGNSK